MPPVHDHQPWVWDPGGNAELGNEHPLTISVKTLDGENRGMQCCYSPETLRVAVQTGSMYELQVTLLRRWGSDARQQFDLLVSLEP